MKLEQWVTCDTCDQTFAPEEMGDCECKACQDVTEKERQALGHSLRAALARIRFGRWPDGDDATWEQAIETLLRDGGFT